MSFRYSLYLGIFCIGVFTVFGDVLGLQIFKSQDAGSFIQILAWLCPFLYLATSSGSILNGLGKTKLTFFHHLVSLLIRIAFVWFGIPEFGIRACLWGMLASEMLLALLHILALRRIVPYDWNAWILIGKPVFCLLCACGSSGSFRKRFRFRQDSRIFSGLQCRYSFYPPCISCFCCFFTENRVRPLHDHSSNSTVT